MDKLGIVIILMCVMSVTILWGGWEVIDAFFIDDTIITSEIITPEIKIVVKDNVIDTLYIYRKP